MIEIKLGAHINYNSELNEFDHNPNIRINSFSGFGKVYICKKRNLMICWGSRMIIR